MPVNKAHIAIANVKGSEEYKSIKGTVTFQQYNNGVMVTSRIFGLPHYNEKCKNGFYALHIHNGSSCSGNADDAFADAGQHYNPQQCEHPYHAGDLPPLFSNNGYAYCAVLINKFTVDEIIGKTIVIHENADDFTTQPSGNSGKKIACGVIGRRMRNL